MDRGLGKIAYVKTYTLIALPPALPTGEGDIINSCAVGFAWQGMVASRFLVTERHKMPGKSQFVEVEICSHG
jgi:hypothetical protein